MKPTSDNPYEPPQSESVETSDWKTWSPFQPKIVRKVCANMTDAEKSTVTRHGIFYGVWTCASFALPVQLMAMGLLAGNLNRAVSIVGGLLIVAHIVCIPIWQRRQRKFLCSTKWARDNGIQPENLKRFKWRRTTNSN